MEILSIHIGLNGIDQYILHDQILLAVMVEGCVSIIQPNQMI